jgi:LysR family transcriptional regulator, low CO2-responsive transcriptional regulator
MDWAPDMRQLRAFIAVAEEGSFTLAARKLFVTQSAVSHSLRALEEQLNCRLLDRTGKWVTVTAEGELLLKSCRRVMHELDQVMHDLDGLKRWGQKTLRIGAPHSLCYYLIPSVLREFRDCFPMCETSIDAADTAELLEKLDGGELDLVLGLKSKVSTDRCYRKLFDDHLVFVVSPLHPWASGKIDVLASVSQQQFIIYAKATETHRMVEEWMEKMVGKMKKPSILGDMQAIKEIAKLGTGVGIVAPWVAAKEIEEGRLVVVHTPGQRLEREWGAYFKSQREPSLIEQTLIGICKIAFENFPD